MKFLLANPSFKYPINNRFEKYFIRSGSRWPHSGIKKKASTPHYLPFPFFLAYTASLLLKERHDVYVLDAVALDYDDEEFLNEAQIIKPEAILFETTTPTIAHDLYIARRLKDSTCAKIILAGPHASFDAESLLENNIFIDYILKGEYELNCAALARQLSNKTSFSKVEGLVFRDGNNIISNSESLDTDESLDILPLPARNLFPSNSISDINRYWDGFCQFWPAIQMQATRGCPYRCYYCLWNEVMYKKKRYRKFSPPRVVGEMGYLIKEYGAHEIYFDDDDFTIDRDYVYEVCRLIIKDKLNIKWSCMADAINLDKDMLRIMKEAGCVGIKFGLESLSPKVLAALGKPVSIRRAEEIIRYCSRYRIKSHATFSLGLLNEDTDSLGETLKKIKGLDVDTIQISFATPFPGTRFHELAKSEGFINANGWEDYDGRRKQIIKYPHLGEKELERYKTRLYRCWLINRILKPLWFFRQLSYLKRYIEGQGLRRFLGQVVNIIYDL